MNVLIVVASAENALRIVAWTRPFVQPEDRLEFLCLESDGGSETQSALQSVISDFPVASIDVVAIEFENPVGQILERCRKFSAKLLITAQFSAEPLDARPQTSDELVRSAPCEAISPLTNEIGPGDVKKVLMIVNQGAHDIAALRLTEKLRQKLNATVTLATIEQATGSKAELAGEKAIESVLHDVGVDAELVETKVVVDRLRHRGIMSCVDDQELIVCGIDGWKDIRPLRESLGDRMVLIVKRAPPIRLKSLSDWLPRINPNDHAELLHDLRRGSQWNGDFVSMLSLASAIAALGLLQDSPAVVIGSMLLAPLMTPMIGAGLAIAQANVKLAKRCLRTILLGILLAFCISFFVGWIMPSRETDAPEVLARCSPNILDLLIAFCAAIAATIAMARPNIAGAIAGVAIATALVPPICAVGLSVANGHFQNAIGALVLFGTNLVAIIVASSFTFSMLGVISGKSLPRHRKINQFAKWGLPLLLILLAGPLTLVLVHQLEQGRPQPAVFPVTRAVARALQSRVAQDEGVEIIFMARSSVGEGVVVQIAANRDLPESYADDIREIVRAKMNDQKTPIFVYCLRGQWISKSEP